MHTARVVDAIHEDVTYMKQAMEAANTKYVYLYRKYDCLKILTSRV